MTKEQPVNVTSTGIAVAIAVVVAMGFLFFGSALFAPFAPEMASEAEMAPAETSNTNTSGNSMITDVVVGTGEEAVPGKTVSVHYTGTFEDGTVFDSSINRGQPISFVLGAGMVIQGWEQGINGMKVGGKRHLVIPGDLAYGPAGRGSIPPNATLIFDVELVDVQ